MQHVVRCKRPTFAHDSKKRPAIKKMLPERILEIRWAAVKEHEKLRFLYKGQGFVADRQGEISDKEIMKFPERIFFHLVENTEPDYPFAFVATYSGKVRGSRIKHKPLQYALTEYKGDRGKLMDLLSCLNRAAAVLPMIDHFVKSGEMFHPLRLRSSEAYTFLKDVPKIEESGIPFMTRRAPNKTVFKDATAGNLDDLMSQKYAYRYGERLVFIKKVKVDVCGYEGDVYLCID